MSFRHFELADIDGLNALRAEAGWAPLQRPHWEWQLQNPARGDTPVGWVLDRNGSIDGFVGNFIQSYYRGSERFRAATGHEILVSRRARGAAKRAIFTFLDQPDMFVCGTLNANTLSAPIHRKLGLTPYPPQTDALKLGWILSPLALAKARLYRRTAQRFPDWPLWRKEHFTPHRAARFDARTVKWPIGVQLISSLDDNSDYARFWEDLRADGRLVADRSPALMRWRTADPNLKTRPLLLAWRDEKGLAAYGWAQLSKMGTIDTAVLEILDLVALERASEEAIPALVDAMKLAGRRMGASKVRLHVLSLRLKARLGRQMASAREEGGWGHGHVRFNQPMEDFADWDPTPFDSCYSYNLRQPRFS